METIVNVNTPHGCDYTFYSKFDRYYETTCIKMRPGNCTTYKEYRTRRITKKYFDEIVNTYPDKVWQR